MANPAGILTVIFPRADAAVAAARVARLRDHAAVAAALRTGPRDGEELPAGSGLTLTATLGAGGGRRARRRAGSLCTRRSSRAAGSECWFRVPRGFLERDFEVVTKVGARCGPPRRPPPPKRSPNPNISPRLPNRSSNPRNVDGSNLTRRRPRSSTPAWPKRSYRPASPRRRGSRAASAASLELVLRRPCRPGSGRVGMHGQLAVRALMTRPRRPCATPEHFVIVALAHGFATFTIAAAANDRRSCSPRASSRSLRPRDAPDWTRGSRPGARWDRNRGPAIRSDGRHACGADRSASRG